MATKNNQLNRYKFTLKYDICPDKKELITWLKANCKKWVFQHEEGDTGYNHFGGRFSLRKKRRPNELINLLQKTEVTRVMWTSPEVTTNDDDFYDTKEDTRIDGPWKDTDEEIYIPRQCRGHTWYPWQQHIIDDIGVWNTRTINMIYDPEGCHGKSTICQYLDSARKAIMLPTLNDYKEMLAIAYDMPVSNMYLIDMPRGLKKDKLGGMYSAIESIKQGYVFDIRYHFRRRHQDCPNIWVFSNILPEFKLLSKDRWIVWEIDDKNELKRKHFF